MTGMEAHLASSDIDTEPQTLKIATTPVTTYICHFYVTSRILHQMPFQATFFFFLFSFHFKTIVIFILLSQILRRDFQGQVGINWEGS